MPRYNVRCSREKCKARAVFHKHPLDYIRKPKCWACGGTEFRIDRWHMKRDSRAAGCMCSGYAWGRVMSGAMHRRGSKWCWYRADGTQRFPGDPDFAGLDYQHLETQEESTQ